jgi:phytoene synthase
MSILSKPRREAMHAVYAFCREVDDIADDASSVVDKRLGLAAWRAEIDNLYRGAPRTPTGLALLAPVRAFDLPREEFILMIEGMEMDAEGPIVAPTMEQLLAYTRRVAGAVGMLSMPVFGAPRNEAAKKFALSLGDALQLTNILRDIAEDARIGRLYLPRELLAQHGAALTAEAIVGSPGLPPVARDLAEVARRKFADTRAALKELNWRILRPALLMMGVYEEYLQRMERRGWNRASDPVSISKVEKSAIAARWFFAPRLKGA